MEVLEGYCGCAQVLGEIFNAIHRADLGGAAEKAADLQLPRKVRLPAPGASPAAAAAAIAAAEGKPTANGGGASSQGSSQSLVQRLFGLDMQVSHAVLTIVTSKHVLLINRSLDSCPCEYSHGPQAPFCIPFATSSAVLAA